MILFQKEPDSNSNSKVIVLFGAGLIGTAVGDAINTLIKGSWSYYPFAWSDIKARRKDSEYINKSLLRILTSINSGETDIAFIWCAGRAGFGADEDDIQKEFSSFKQVLEIINKTHKLNMTRHTSVHLLSSAGGLFENFKLVDHNSVPQPRRDYGRLKLKQEELLLQMNASIGKFIYRPSSVFGYIGPGQRMGLIPTLLKNGLTNKVSTIYGNLSTLRDYVSNKDIGMFISQCVLGIMRQKRVNYFLLASGKPSSIYEIKHCVERTINKKIYLNFYSTAETENISDITISSLALPANWKSADLNTEIHAVKNRILSGMSYRLVADNLPRNKTI
ncbi:MAG: NAD-dependent epimerase/dehydratase family protein [Xanthomonadales bacterium]|nr:NAD-dependent epimerase/dehydratase family protein [Xanthomonadales bacterium]